MAVVIKKEIWTGTRVNLCQLKQVHGAGAPANGDWLVTNLKTYPIGTMYIDTTAGISYMRCLAAGLATDYKALNA